jgi:phosphoglycolate phosphatase
MAAGLAAFVFDFDGTLAATNIDFGAMREDAYGLIRDCGVFSEDLMQHMVLEMVAIARDRLGCDTPQAAELDRQVQAALRRRELEAARRAQALPGVLEALSELRARGCQVGVITRNCREAVEAFAARYPFPCDALVTRDEARAVKPEPAHLLQALDSLGAQPRHSAMVGDHWSDVQCGRAAGCWAIGVLTDRTPREKLQEAGADAVLDSAALLPAWLDGVPCPVRRGEAQR